MFYDRFRELCARRGISCNKAAAEIGLSNATPTAWKKRGLTPKADTLQMIADYFGVSIDYLLDEETEKAPTQKGEREITYDDFTYAMLEETKDLPPEKKAMLLEMARFMRADMEKEK